MVSVSNAGSLVHLRWVDSTRLSCVTRVYGGQCVLVHPGLEKPFTSLISQSPPKRGLPSRKMRFFYSHQKVTLFGVNSPEKCNFGCEWGHRWCEHVRGVDNLVEVCTYGEIKASAFCRSGLCGPIRGRSWSRVPQDAVFPTGKCDPVFSHQKVTHFGVNRPEKCNFGCERGHLWCEHVRGVDNLVEVCTYGEIKASAFGRMVGR